MMSRGFFITGTDTGVGKTVIAAAVIKALHAKGIQACGMKPIETGCQSIGETLFPSDGMFLKKVARMDETINHITPYCFASPVAPSVASETENRVISTAVIMEAFAKLLAKYGTVVVEGIGGILVPIRRDFFVIDLVRELNLPLIVVSKPSLGTINHTLLTVNYALNMGVTVSGIIMNFTRPQGGTIAEETNPHVIQQMCPVPLIGIFPYLNTMEDEILERNALKHLNIELLQKHLMKGNSL
jgi:dethiobiotin synthetase